MEDEQADTGCYAIYHDDGSWEPSRYIADVRGQSVAEALVTTLNRRAGAEWDDEDQDYFGAHYFARPVVARPISPDRIELSEGLHPGMDDERLTDWRRERVWDTEEPLNGRMPPIGTRSILLYRANCTRCGKRFGATHYSGVQKSVSLHWKTRECTQQARRNNE